MSLNVGCVDEVNIGSAEHVINIKKDWELAFERTLKELGRPYSDLLGSLERREKAAVWAMIVSC